MAIDVYLRNEQGETLDSVNGVFLQPAMPAMDDESSPCLRFIDPCGDTIFNRRQMAPLLRELSKSRAIVGIDPESIDGIAALIERCAAGTHLYLWFVGD